MTVYKVTLTSVRAGDPTNPFVNVFGYDAVEPVDYLGMWDAFVAEFRSTVIDNIRPVVCETMTFQKLALVGSGDGAVAWEHIFVPPPAGQADAQEMPKFVAWGFQYDRLTVGNRSGAKRFGVVSENSVTNGVATGGLTTPLNNLAVALGSTLTTSPANQFVPVILHKTGANSFVGHDISGVRYVRVTTQNSRKR